MSRLALKRRSIKNRSRSLYCYIKLSGRLTGEDIINAVADGTNVKQVMSHNIVSANKGEHLMIVPDRMVKNKYRRLLPVMDNGKPIGIVYISDIYHHLFSDVHSSADEKIRSYG